MKIGVFSDVHGNLEALDACLARFEKERVEKFIFCGDMVGYGPDPEICVKKIFQLPLLACVVGNHDAALCHPVLEAFFNYDAQIALEEGKKHLSAFSFRSLAELPAKIEGKNFCVVHGTPADPVKEYFTNDAQFYANAPLWKGQVCFVGHTHLPFYMEGTTEDCLVSLVSRPEQVIPLASHARYVINPGAVGKPRDKNPQAAFGIWDNSKNTFQFLREPYDVQKTQEKMRKLNFPDFLIESLAIGY